MNAHEHAFSVYCRRGKCVHPLRAGLHLGNGGSFVYHAYSQLSLITCHDAHRLARDIYKNLTTDIETVRDFDPRVRGAGRETALAAIPSFSKSWGEPVPR
ncbi:hypothetical protein GWI33_017174 [Rhynchophorus ferrugineus]|uniref:Uncharacterized protein n=1 Tax=Rhynchophorus ferrugineus TaxID=354439 RepID=A0A834I2H2_RHYFE|nr:hypothetical protein GWI33_017174 [Rhynchophorus ferrugineus]